MDLDNPIDLECVQEDVKNLQPTMETPSRPLHPSHSSRKRPAPEEVADIRVLRRLEYSEKKVKSQRKTINGLRNTQRQLTLENSELKDKLRVAENKLKAARRTIAQLNKIVAKLRTAVSNKETTIKKLDKKLKGMVVDIEQLVYVLDRKLISNEQYRELTVLCTALPRAYAVIKFRKELDAKLADQLKVGMLA
jgi:chromosome segregation ATPase